MNKINNKKIIPLICFSLIWMVFSQILFHYNTITDPVRGGFWGIGIGLLLVALWKRKKMMVL